VRGWPRALALASFALVSACVSRPPQPPVPPKPTNAVEAGVRLEQPPAAIDEAQAQRALAAFLVSCPALVTRQDKSGLATGADWAGVCAEAAAVAPGSASAFFRDHFDWVRVGDGKAFATGYYEPELAGSRVADPAFPVPLYRVPPDLVRCVRPDGTNGRGRLDATGTCLPYFTRAEIEGGALAGKGLEVAWAADPVDAFFMEIQGSGRLRLADGSVMRLGYAEQNGHAYVAIGKLLRDRGLLPPGGASMQSIRDWITSHPAEGRALMLENPSYIFFRELTGPGPLGALNVPVTPRTTVAADPAFVPLGAPVFLTVDRPEANGLWVAQDTGGAIKQPNRFDTFWGAGPDAVRIAGGMSASGQALILLPKGVAARALAKR
jgi:membrane-bound lytic murein transglycosylase A